MGQRHTTCVEKPPPSRIDLGYKTAGYHHITYEKFSTRNATTRLHPNGICQRIEHLQNHPKTRPKKCFKPSDYPRIRLDGFDTRRDCFRRTRLRMEWVGKGNRRGTQHPGLTRDHGGSIEYRLYIYNNQFADGFPLCYTRSSREKLTLTENSKQDSRNTEKTEKLHLLLEQ